VEEYGSKALTAVDFQGHHFNEESKIWEQTKKKRGLSRQRRSITLPKRTTPLVYRLK
jgi:hypothetical protein